MKAQESLGGAGYRIDYYRQRLLRLLRLLRRSDRRWVPRWGRWSGKRASLV